MARKANKNKGSIKSHKRDESGYSGTTIATEDTEVNVSVDVTPSTEEGCEKEEETTPVDVSVEVDVTPTPEDCVKEEAEEGTQIDVSVETDVTPNPEDCEKEEEQTTEVDVSVEVDVTPQPEDCEKEEGTQVEVSVEADVTPSVVEGEECEESSSVEVDVSVDVPVTADSNECVEIPSNEWNSSEVKDAINFGTEWNVQKAIKKGKFSSSCDWDIKKINSVCKTEDGDNTYYTISNLSKVKDGKKSYALDSQVTVKSGNGEESVTKWKYNVSAWKN